MKWNSGHQMKNGEEISYDDGRPWHEDVEATILAVDGRGMTLQFDDRADTPTPCSRTDGGWILLLSLIEHAIFAIRLSQQQTNSCYARTRQLG